MLSEFVEQGLGVREEVIAFCAGETLQQLSYENIGDFLVGLKKWMESIPDHLSLASATNLPEGT